MSRIQIPQNDVFNPDHKIWVGWDSPLESFFGQVYDMSRNEEIESQVVYWVGVQVGEIFDLLGLVESMKDYCHISDDVRQQLLQDYKNRTEPSELQRITRSLFPKLPILIDGVEHSDFELLEGQRLEQIGLIDGRPNYTFKDLTDSD